MQRNFSGISAIMLIVFITGSEFLNPTYSTASSGIIETHSVLITGAFNWRYASGQGNLTLSSAVNMPVTIYVTQLVCNQENKMTLGSNVIKRNNDVKACGRITQKREREREVRSFQNLNPRII